MNSINTWLPIFSGTYGTIWECSMDEYEMDWINEQRETKGFPAVEWDQIEFDYVQYYKDMSEMIVNEVENELKNFVYSIEFQKMESPREYNFVNASIHCTIKPRYKAIKQYIKDHFTAWNKYLQDNYTSCDGFISFHDNFAESEEWKMTKALKDLHGLGAVLNFIAINEEIEEMDMFDNVQGNISINVKNYDKLTDTEIID